MGVYQNHMGLDRCQTGRSNTELESSPPGSGGSSCRLHSVTDQPGTSAEPVAASRDETARRPTALPFRRTVPGGGRQRRGKFPGRGVMLSLTPAMSTEVRADGGNQGGKINIAPGSRPHPRLPPAVGVVSFRTRKPAGNCELPRIFRPGDDDRDIAAGPLHRRLRSRCCCPVRQSGHRD